MNKLFWAGIKFIDWASHGDIELGKRRLNQFLSENKKITREQFEKIYNRFDTKVCNETVRRVKKGIRVFAPGVMHGCDDCHFTDMPAHLVGLGLDRVNEYMAGGLIDFTPIECLSYIFHTDED